MALGLHVRNDDRSASEAQREMLSCTWWSLYRLERQIGIMTGRPSMIVEQFCSVPPPAPYSERYVSEDARAVNSLWSSNASLNGSFTSHSHMSVGSCPTKNVGLEEVSTHFGVAYDNSGPCFRAAVQLYTITQSIITSLYTSGTRMRSPDEDQQDIVQLDQRLDDWLAKLPGEINFQTHPHDWVAPQAPFLRERTLLAFQFYSAKILLTRPCLGGFTALDQHNQATIRANFTQRMASTCVKTAQAIVNLLPDQPHPHFLYEYGPWWTMVHNLMQALAVLLLALHYSSDAPEDNTVLARYCRKIVRWLHSLNNALADRAYRVAVYCFEAIAKRLELPVSDELITENLFSMSYGKQNLETQAANNRIPPLDSSASYNYAGVADSSAFLAHGSSMVDRLYLHSWDEQVSDRYQNSI